MNLHGPVRVGQTASVGNAKVMIAFDSWKEGAVASTQHEIPVVAPRSRNLKLEPVSSRLKGELIHPNKTGTIANIEFSPDGTRILAGNYPGGVIALWDVASGKRLTTLEAGYGYHGSKQYYAVSPDWRTVFAHREKRQSERFEQEGKRMVRWTFGGDVRAWNLEDGKLLRTYKRQPQSNVRSMHLSPDGKTFFTLDELPGITEGRAKMAVSLWDVKTGTYRTMEGWQHGDFSPDGRSLTLVAQDERSYAQEMKRIDVSTGRKKWSLPIIGKYVHTTVSMFSRDGAMLFGVELIYESARAYNNYRSRLKWWDAATGREIASFESDKNDVFTSLCTSPDGQTLAALNWRSDTRKLFLYSIAEKRLLRTVLLCEKTGGLRPIASGLTFHPSGNWLVVVTRSVPEKKTGDDLDPRDLPQPRILLIETATGAIRETLVAPQSFSNDACFSPDGRTLATDGHGRVLLWDMTKMPQ